MLGNILKMKYILLVILFFSIKLIFCQGINLSTEFSWSKVEKNNPALIKKFINLTPQEFQYYKQNDSYAPTIDDLIKDLHVLDINNDSLDDIIFDGRSGGEPREISIYLNKGSSFKNIFTDYQGITKLEFENGILNKINIKDWGCCAEFIVTNKCYEVGFQNEEFKFDQKKSFKYVEKTILPDKYWANTKKVKILNDNYNLRYSPQIDNTTEVYFDGEPSYGNTIGKLVKNSMAIAIAEFTDSTGRVWFFVAIYPEYDVKESYFYDSKDEMKSYKCGWISSRFIEIQE
jgi:hypothetical protein